MLPVMVPLQRRLDLDEDVGRFSIYTRLEGFVTVAAMARVQPGQGAATVDGVPLSRWESVELKGVTLLFLPLAEVAPEYGRRCRVSLRGFRAPGGMPFPRCDFTVTIAPRRQADPAFAEHDAAALEAAREGMVLLRNENGALPLSETATLNCLGSAQHWWRSSMAGASRINPRHRPGFHQAVAEHSRFRVNAPLAEFYRRARRDERPDDALLDQARGNGGPALVFIGRQWGEMMDLRDIDGEYRLSAAERDLLRCARARFDRVIVILNTGGPIDMDWLREIDVDAVLFTGYAGMLSAHALVELLDGRVNPSGHLPDTWPWRFSDNPVSRNFPQREPDAPYIHEDAVGVRVYYEEDIYMGYRYFDSFGVPVAFPFGHGLSYTSFELKPLGLTRRGDRVMVGVEARNTGRRAGKAVAQLYVAPPPGKMEKPDHVLVGFEKTALLEPGQGQVLELRMRLEDAASFDEAGSAWVLEAGDYAFWVGQSLSDRVPAGTLALEARTLRRVTPVAPPMEDFKRLTRSDPTVDGTKSRVVPLGEQIAVPAPRAEAEDGRPAARRTGRRILWAEVQADPSKLAAFVGQMSLLDLCRLNVCAGMRVLPNQDGMAGYTPRLEAYGLPSFAASDANAGLNLKRPNIGFPASSVIAATFNRDIARTVGRVVAEECRDHGVDLVLAPGMNLHRSPLCGRHPEYFSEDPCLTGIMAGCHARGLEERGVAGCYKHLFCNNAELGRLGSHSVVSRQALRELYFRAFEIAFREHSPRSAMTSYNALNGIYPGENRALLEDLLRGEWGFKGFVMSDWGSVRTVDAVAMVNAGNSWITPGGPKWVRRLWRAARQGGIARTTLERNAMRLLKGFGGRF
ncbi:MAG: glycoside hydrolase family 3 C-terminal domain-containing protein [Clostridia bacterium]|nr:glycoside hydrolase family 3 C-terminal domain-containing protein [Clostridia bacterium]